MKVLIDACVLYPTVLREIVIGLAGEGIFTPLWSDRILEEWRRAAARRGSDDQRIAGVEVSLLRDRFPDATVSYAPEIEARLVLPDPNDTHVLAAAIAGNADELLTLNVKDFPTNVLSQEGILRRQPDEFLFECHGQSPDIVKDVLGAVLARATAHGIDTSNPRSLMKKARLPRLGKALYA